MVSNAVKMSQKEVIAALKRLRSEHSGDPEYKKLRKELPKEWPI
jgi:type III secretory pathway component EscU